MLRSRSRLPVLAEISGPAEGRGWALGRGDFAALEEILPRLAQRRVVLVAGEGEEPAIAAIALAAAAAASGRRTVLVDCDLARARLAAHLGLAPAPGVHEYLRWEAEPKDVLQPVALFGRAAAGASEPLACICSGRPATKAETLLGLQSFSHMVGKLRDAYELVLVLAPPVKGEPGACHAVARQADAVLAGLPAGGGDRSIRTTIRRLPPPALGSVAVAA
jgi:succinoglycan biosynthesis transport protein ExoP